MQKNYTVTNSDERPARRDGNCFYCHQPIGGVHLPDCVIVSKSVVVRFSIDLVCEQPASWDRSDTEGRYNEGSWCADNLLQMLTDLASRGGCLCDFVKAEYLREATQEDHDDQKFTFES